MLQLPSIVLVLCISGLLIGASAQELPEANTGQIRAEDIQAEETEDVYAQNCTLFLKCKNAIFQLLFSFQI